MCNKSFYRFWYLPRNDTNADVVIHHFDVHFQDPAFSFSAFAITIVQQWQLMSPGRFASSFTAHAVEMLLLKAIFQRLALSIIYRRHLLLLTAIWNSVARRGTTYVREQVYLRQTYFCRRQTLSLVLEGTYVDCLCAIYKSMYRKLITPNSFNGRGGSAGCR